MYAMGYDKDEDNKDLNSFVNGDIESFKKKYPDLIYEKIEIGKTAGIIDATMLSFSKLSDRFKEEVIYLETDLSILVFVFSAYSKSDFENYQSTFDAFMSSFNYRGSNPKPFLEWQKNNK